MAMSWMALTLLFVIGGGLLTSLFWSSISAYSGTYVSRLKMWIVGLTGGTGASFVAVYTQYVDGILIPAYDFFISILTLDWASVNLWGFYTFVAIVGCQVLPVIVIIANYISSQKLVIEPDVVKSKRRKASRG